jgi:hypothetical protein
MNRLQKLGLALALTAPLTLADFKYEQTSRMTGGAMMAMMKMAARFNKSAMEPTSTTVAVKGNRMVMNHGKTAMIYDLDKETVTDVNFEKKEYSVMTFAEMKAFVEKNMKAAPGRGATVDVDVKETGKTDVIAGMKTREFLLSMKFEAANPQTGKTGEMKMEMSNWMAPKLPGYEEVNAFYVRMGQKMDMASMFGGAASGMGKGMAEAAKKMSMMDGVPLLQITRMMPTDPEQMKQMEQAAQAQEAQQSQQAQQGQGPTAGQVAEDAAGQAATGALAGRLGRIGGLGGALGGLGRKRSSTPPPPPPPPPPAAAAPAAPVEQSKGSFTSTASLIEMTIETKSHSNSSVDEGMFAVPGGFKLVKSAMQR